MSLVIVNSAVDSLYFYYKGEAVEGFFENLEDLKEQAKTREEKVPTKIGEEELVISPFGARMFRYLLSGRNFSLKVSPSAMLPNLMFQMLAECLYQEGHQAAFERADRVAAEIGMKDDAKLSRIDLCVDFQGWVPSEDRQNDFVCRANQEVTWRTGKSATGFQFGKGQILARIYNKTAESIVHNKGWMEAVWCENPAYNEKEPVWRLEFQFRGKALKEFGAGTVIEAFSKLKGLWEYGLGWLSLRAGEESRLERRPIDPAWAALGQANFPGRSCERVKATKGLGSMERTLAMMLGYSSTLGALVRIESMEDVLRWAMPEMEFICRQQGRSFADRVKKKIALQEQGEMW